MEERSWWDLWNTSYRSQDKNCTVSSELFDHVAGIVRSLSNDQPRRILEVACGTGTLSRQLSFSHYHGLDISPAAIEIANTRASEPGTTGRHSIL
jgi:ubiquinone/menaquinone biosynthesis C-methylase UbiE